MIHFAQLEYLFLLLLIPLFFILNLLYRRAQRKKVERIGNVELVERLMPLRSRAKSWVRLVFFSLAWFFLVVALARPQIGARLKEKRHKGAEIMIALDVSLCLRRIMLQTGWRGQNLQSPDWWTSWEETE